MNYDVEADWVIFTTCNFRCPYCFFTEDILRKKLEVHGTPQQWEEGFDATGRKWLIHITGGEPTLHPKFVELCERLSRNHYLSINTNLSQDKIYDFAERVDPRRIHFINAAVHSQERQRISKVGPFVEKAKALQEAGFNCFLSLVMTDHVVENYRAIEGEFENNGLHIIPKIIRGTHDGKKYPRAYTQDQVEKIDRYLAEAQVNYSGMLLRMGEEPTIDVFGDSRFLGGIPNYRGRLCSAGQKFVMIEPDGNVARCRSGESYGNILSKNVELADGPKICNTKYCHYFCEKYSTRGSILSQGRGVIYKLAHKAKRRGSRKRARSRDAARPPAGALDPEAGSRHSCSRSWWERRSPPAQTLPRWTEASNPGRSAPGATPTAARR